MLQWQGHFFPPPLGPADQTDGVHGVQPQVGHGGDDAQYQVVPRPQASGDEDLNLPAYEAILPPAMLEHSDILAVVMNIRNATLRKTILLKQDINYTKAAQILNKANQNKNFNIVKLVFLKLDVAMELPERLFKIEQVIIHWEVLKAINIVYNEQVIHTSESELTWLILNDTMGVGNLCKIEESKIIGDDEDNEDNDDDDNEDNGDVDVEGDGVGDDKDHEDSTGGKQKIDSENTTRIAGQTEEPQAVTFLEVISFCAWPFSSF